MQFNLISYGFTVTGLTLEQAQQTIQIDRTYA